MKKGILLVSFDFWNTLATPNPEYAKNRMEIFRQYSSLPDDEIKRIHKKVKGELDAEDEATGIARSSFDCFRRLFHGLNPDLMGFYTTGVIQEFCDKTQEVAAKHPPIILPETLYMLRSVLHSGFGVALLSNTNFIKGTTLRPLFAMIEGFRFNVTAFSDEVLFSKPHPEMFRQIQKRFPNMEPKNVLHIGDNKITDYEGALKFGFDALLVSDPADTINKVNDLLS